MEHEKFNITMQAQTLLWTQNGTSEVRMLVLEIQILMTVLSTNTNKLSVGIVLVISCMLMEMKSQVLVIRMLLGKSATRNRSRIYWHSYGEMQKFSDVQV